MYFKDTITVYNSAPGANGANFTTGSIKSPICLPYMGGSMIAIPDAYCFITSSLQVKRMDTVTKN
jgi:hypothetical protein